MRGRSFVLAVALIAAAPAAAHHSIAGMYDGAKPVRLDGTVTAFQFVSPHPFLEVDVRGNDGRTERWRLEMDNRFELVQVGMTGSTLVAGDRVTATGSPARDGSRSLYVRELRRPADGFYYEQVGFSPRVQLPKR